MSKFEELCNEYAAARNRYFGYRDECNNFAQKFIDGLVNYLGCPREVISFHPAKESEERSGTIYSLMGVMTLQSDTYWHFNMGILVYEASNISPKERFLFDVALKKNDGRFAVKATSDGAEFIIDEMNQASFTPVYDEIFELILNRYKKGLEKFLEKNDQVRTIGFNVKS